MCESGKHYPHTRWKVEVDCTYNYHMFQSIEIKTSRS